MGKKFFSVVLTSLMAMVLFVPHSEAASASGDEVIKLAKKHLGTPYQWSGETPAGFDCSGFTYYIMKKFGVNLSRGSYDQYKQGTYVAKSNLQKGDLVFFSGTHKQGVSHVGFYIGDGNMISATRSRGIAIDPVFSGYWGDKYTGAKRFLTNSFFNDVSSNYWAYDEIKQLNKEGIINGYSDGNFGPADNVTRAQVAKMVGESLNLQPSSTNQFKDVSSSHWAYGYINAAVKAGLVTGYENGTFKPDEAITRAEIAAIINRAFEFSNDSSSYSFNDMRSSHWAYDDVYVLASNSITSGYVDNTFRPNEEATRAEFSAFLYRALN
ncbi:S-layer homology domain-containing protein [Halobacillus dabanensis]|uniref:S-layer homology domain-containing protein n=1 Tax=Halobacillus dabanensis TaxID=240302 RepID=A0A1I3S9E8_HALDA|nr:C40 family peptidase [Halobacillus dabanensis]SFJ54157.1 S-layer homology domain-containing protein [Halobacillus dabanensis]